MRRGLAVAAACIALAVLGLPGLVMPGVPAQASPRATVAECMAAIVRAYDNGRNAGPVLRSAYCTGLDRHQRHVALGEANRATS